MLNPQRPCGSLVSITQETQILFQSKLKLVFKGESSGLTHIPQSDLQCTRRYSNLLIVFMLTLDVNGSWIINQGKTLFKSEVGFLEGRMKNQQERTLKWQSTAYYSEPLGLRDLTHLYVYIYTTTKYIHLYNHARTNTIAITLAPHSGLMADELDLGLFEEASASGEPANRTRDHSSVPVSSGCSDR